jgi:hypothetical protein
MLVSNCYRMMNVLGLVKLRISVHAWERDLTSASISCDTNDTSLKPLYGSPHTAVYSLCLFL